MKTAILSMTMILTLTAAHADLPTAADLQHATQQNAARYMRAHGWCDGRHQAPRRGQIVVFYDRNCQPQFKVQ